MTNKDYLKKKKLIPDSPGVYFFKKGKKYLYIGKATSLKQRINSYFSNNVLRLRGSIIEKMVFETTVIEWKETDSALEALILEANLIKKYQPVYNLKEKDNKSYNYIAITDDEYPRVLIVRGREIEKNNQKYLKSKIFGPYPSGGQLKEAIKIIRKFFPFRDKCDFFQRTRKARPCFNYQIGLCPGVCVGLIKKEDYKRNIKNIQLMLSGKKKTILVSLKKEMNKQVLNFKFEEAIKIRNLIFALEHIQDVSLLKKDFSNIIQEEGIKKNFRIEAYDIAHIYGESTVAVMVVVENGEIKSSEYRKFKIRGKDGQVRIDDTLNLKEVLERRLGHLMWNLPDLIVLDGGVAQMNLTRKVLKEKGFNIEFVSVVKAKNHKPKEVLGKKSTISKHLNEILLANSEAHRFAITYHRNLLRKSRK